MSAGEQYPSDDGWPREERPDFDDCDELPDIDNAQMDHDERSLVIGICMDRVEPFSNGKEMTESVYLNIGDNDDELVAVFSGTPLREVEKILAEYSTEDIEDTTVKPMSVEQITHEQSQNRVALSSMINPQETCEDEQRYWTFATDDYAHDRSTTIASRMLREFLEQEKIDMTKITDVATHPENMGLAGLHKKFTAFVEADRERMGDVSSPRMTIIRSLNDGKFSRIDRNRLAKHIVIPTIKAGVDRDVLEECIQFLGACDEEFLTQALQTLIYNSSRKTQARCLTFISEMADKYGHVLRRGDIDRIHAILISVEASEAQPENNN